MLPVLIYYFTHLAGSRRRGRQRAERVLNAEVLYVRYLIGWIAKTLDYINRVNLMLPISVYKGTWTHSPHLVAMHLLDRSCVSVGIFLKLHATFPNMHHVHLAGSTGDMRAARPPIVGVKTGGSRVGVPKLCV